MPLERRSRHVGKRRPTGSAPRRNQSSGSMASSGTSHSTSTHHTTSISNNSSHSIDVSLSSDDNDEFVWDVVEEVGVSYEKELKAEEDKMTVPLSTSLHGRRRSRRNGYDGSTKTTSHILPTRFLRCLLVPAGAVTIYAYIVLILLSEQLELPKAKHREMSMNEAGGGSSRMEPALLSKASSTAPWGQEHNINAHAEKKRSIRRIAINSIAKNDSTATSSPPFSNDSSHSHLPSAHFRLEANLQRAQELLKDLGTAEFQQRFPQAVIAAYVEPIHDEYLQNATHRTTPLPRRLNKPDDLRKFEYPLLKTCKDLPGKLPTGRPYESYIGIHNYNNLDTQLDDWETERWNLARQGCPVEADPFLPWIHDIFASPDGRSIQFVAQNRRRCQTGHNSFLGQVSALTPQVTLMQPVSVKRVDEEQVKKMAADLWEGTTTATSTLKLGAIPRYQLAPYKEADADGQFTRFICRFHTVDYDQRQPSRIILGETLSQYPFNYEFLTFRKNLMSMLTEAGGDKASLWESTLQFSCPVPQELQEAVRKGTTVLNDGTPTVLIDLVPIRTPARYEDEFYFRDGMVGPRTLPWSKRFNATEQWGESHIVPRVEASGRWSNLPICTPPSSVAMGAADTKNIEQPNEKNNNERQESNDALESNGPKKPYQLTACLWSSASFKHRGSNQAPVGGTQERLFEWIMFHLSLAGFDHIYVYDNSGANTNETDLSSITDHFSDEQVTHIHWPSLVCNNNLPQNKNPGERSSQYAAENSCLARYGYLTEWMASIDVDEYLVPMGNHTSLKTVVEQAAAGGTNILTFRSTRGKLRVDASDHHQQGRLKQTNKTFLESYNCDGTIHPPSGQLEKPSWADRAKKQLFRPSYVLQRFVHYSTVTQLTQDTFNESEAKGFKWLAHPREKAPVERIVDELTEATMIHSKHADQHTTQGYQTKCHYQIAKRYDKCFVGFPWPEENYEAARFAAVNTTNLTSAMEEQLRNGPYKYNCFPNHHVENYWVPQLRKMLAGSHK